MIGSGTVITQRLCGVATHKDGTRMANFRQPGSGSSTESSKCSGAIRLQTVTASSASATSIKAPRLAKDWQ